MSLENKDEGFAEANKRILIFNDLIELEFGSSKRKKSDQEPETQQNQGEIALDEVIEKNNNARPREENSENNEDHSVAPKIRINENGEIVIDKESLVVQDHALIKRHQKLQNSVAVNSTESKVGFYKIPKKCKYWSTQETLLFYKCLNSLGSDFQVMTNIFPNRTRRELKQKYHNENKRNPELIDKLMTAVQTATVADLKNEADVISSKSTMRQELKTQLQKQISYLSTTRNRSNRTRPY